MGTEELPKGCFPDLIIAHYHKLVLIPTTITMGLGESSYICDTEKKKTSKHLNV